MDFTDDVGYERSVAVGRFGRRFFVALEEMLEMARDAEGAVADRRWQLG